MVFKWLKRAMFVLFTILGVVILILFISDIFLTQNMNQRLGDSLYEDTHTVLVEEHTMVYREFGHKDHPTLVFLHGFMGSSYDFRLLYDDLSHEYHLIFFDLIGFGLSDKPSDVDYSRATQATRVLQALTELEIDDFHLVGHSMGGEIALNMVHLDSSRITSLMLFASTGIASNESRSLPLIFYRYVFNNYLLQRLAFQSVHKQSSVKTKEGFENFYYFTHQIPAKTAQAFSQHNDSGSIKDALALMTVKTLIIWGSNDRWVPLSQGNLLHDALPNSELIIIENTGHLPFIEEPEQVISIIRNFLIS